MTDRIGFLGLGDMGRPTASCLARAAMTPLVWSRNPASADSVLPHGAELAPDVDSLCAQSHTIILMLANGAAIDPVPGRGTDARGAGAASGDL